jgi:hypothetical protein
MHDLVEAFVMSVAWVVISIVLTIAFGLGNWVKRICCRKPKARPLVARKERLRSYFCLGLGIEGPALNALYFTDPWLAEPPAYTLDNMREFIRIFSQTCSRHYGFSFDSAIPNMMRLENLSILSGIPSNETCAVFRFSNKGAVSLAFFWYIDGQFYRDIDPNINPQNGLWRPHPNLNNTHRTRLSDFSSFRTQLLDTLHSLATKEIE